MAEYPNSVYAPRAKANRAGLVYTPANTTVGYVEDVTKLDAEVVAVETELGANPKGTSASVLEKIKGIRSLSDATADTIVVKAGNVGIGTTSPAVKLDIANGSTRVMSNYGYFIGNGADSVGFWGDSSNNFGLRVGGTDGKFGVLANGTFLVGSATDNGGGAKVQVTGGLTTTGNVGIGITSPTAYLHLKAGTATANTAPLKFTAGVVNTVPVIGAVEFIDDGTNGHLYITLNVGGVLTRKEIALVA